MSESASGQPPGKRASSGKPKVPSPLRKTGGKPESPAPFALSQEPVTGGPVPVAASGVPAPAYEHLGELPATYGTQSVYLVAYDPQQLFAYWDLDWAAARGNSYALRLCRSADGREVQTVPITASDSGRYLSVSADGDSYCVELGMLGADGHWTYLATSPAVTLPPGGSADDGEAQFATLPFHLSFQRLLELIEGAMGEDEDLTAVLARLQQGDRRGMHKITSALDGLRADQWQTLETILGQRFSVHTAGDTAAPGPVDALLRDRREALDAGAFGSDRLGSSSLPGPGGAGLGSENLASGAMFGSGFALGVLVSPPGGSEAWRLAGPVGASDAAASERTEDLRRAIEHNLGVLETLFSAVDSQLSGERGGFSSAGG